MSMEEVKSASEVEGSEVEEVEEVVEINQDDDSPEEESPAPSKEFDEWYTLRLASQLRQLYQKKELADISVECGSEVLHLHKAVLSCSSGFFRQKLKETPSLSSHKFDFSPEIEPSTFKLVVDSFYTGILCDITEDNAIPLLKASFFLEADCCTEQCTEFLLKALDLDNSLDIFLAAEFCNNEKLLSKATAKVGRHLPHVSTSEGFLDLTSKELMDLLGSDGLQVPNEMVVYEALMGWIKHDPSEREGELSTVLQCVRFPYLSRKFLTEVVANEEMITKNHDAMHAYSSALRYQLGGKKFAKGEPVLKRRDHVVHVVVGSYEQFANEQTKRKIARATGLEEDKPAIQEWVDERVLFPLHFCKEHVIEKHIVGPISTTTTSCIPDKDKGSEVSLDGVIKTRENFFDKYFVRPITQTPCIPRSCMDGEEESQYFDNNPLPSLPDDDDSDEKKTPDKPVSQDILTPSLWTQIS